MMTFCADALPYQEAPWLISQTEDSATPRHRIAAPGEAHEERLIATKLGLNGLQRWQYFRQHYSGKWGDEGQQPVSPRSQQALIKALELLEFPSGHTASLFLTDDGYFELGWKDREGKAIQLEFAPHSFEIYLESAEIDECHPYSEMAKVLRTHSLSA